MFCLTSPLQCSAFQTLFRPRIISKNQLSFLCWKSFSKRHQHVTTRSVVTFIEFVITTLDSSVSPQSGLTDWGDGALLPLEMQLSHSKNIEQVQCLNFETFVFDFGVLSYWGHQEIGKMIH